MNDRARTAAGLFTTTLPLSSNSCPPKVQSQTWKSGLSELLFLVVMA